MAVPLVSGAIGAGFGTLVGTLVKHHRQNISLSPQIIFDQHNFVGGGLSLTKRF